MKKGFKGISGILAAAFLFSGVDNIVGTTYVQAYSQQSSVESNLSIGQKINGFALKNKKHIEGIDSTVYEFEHEKTGAKVLFVKNSDENKVFRIDFKTLPKDNTGVFHIIEHLIGAGMKVKGINPHTIDNYTEYGVDSKEGVDFGKSVDGYLEGFFNPTALNNMCFMREGWRYDINSPEEDLKVNGIVYNEMHMQGSPMEMIMGTIRKSLFPDTIDMFNSGGIPGEMPKLKFEKLLETYKENYVPSNSFSYFYGNVDIEGTLKTINDKHFSKFDKKDFKNEILMQKAFDKMNQVEAYYPVENGTDTKNKTYLALNYAGAKAGDVESVKEYFILSGLVEKHIKKALSNSEIGNGSCMGVGNIQEGLSITVANSEEDKKEKLLEIVNNTLKDIVKNGFDKDEVAAAINSIEMREKLTNVSLGKVDSCLSKTRDAWLFNKDMIKNLETDAVMNNIKEKSKNGYFEKLVKEYFLDNNHSSMVVIKPKPQVIEDKDKLNKEKLAQYKNSLSKDELNKIINQSREFNKWQEKSGQGGEQNKKEEAVSLDSFNRKAEEIPTETKNINGIKVLNHPIHTDGLQYINMYFDTRKMPQDKLMYLVLLTKMLGAVDTEKYTYDKLQSAKSVYTGGIEFYMEAFENSKDLKEYYPKLNISMTTLDSNLEKSLEILNEIIYKSKFTNKNYLRDLCTSLKSNMENEMAISNGNVGGGAGRYQYISGEALAYSSDISKYRNLCYKPFYDFICELNENFDAKYDELASKLQETSKLAFDKENLIMSFTGDKETYSNFEKRANNFIGNLKSNESPIQTYKFDSIDKNKGFIIPSDVNYVVKSVDFGKFGYKNSGSLKVARNILMEYLGDEIRVKGGAYGANINIENNSSIVLSSERDPNLKTTIDAFNNTGSYLKNFTADEKKMQDYIVQALNSLDYRMEPKDKAYNADYWFITGQTQADIQKQRDEIFSTTVEDIRNCGDIIDKAMKESNICVFGSEAKLNENKDLFSKIEKLIK